MYLVDSDPLRDQVYGFGSGKRGQLGISTDKVKSASLPQITLGLTDVKIISINANGDHSAALSGKSHISFFNNLAVAMASRSMILSFR